MRVTGAILAWLAVALATPAVGQGWIETEGVAADPVVKLRTVVRVEVTGRTARVTVEEWFRNDGPALAEGIYHYPFVRDAVFHDFSLWQGDRELKGETLDAERARAIYEAIVRAKRDPALIELVGQRLVRARVFPIQPRETRRIALRYTEHLSRDGDALRFRWLAGARGRTGRLSFELAADSAARFATPYSPTHAITPRLEGDRITVALRDSAPVGTLDLVLPLEQPGGGMTLLTHRPPGEDGYFLLLVAPPRAGAERLARDVTAVLDISGSMSGEKLEQAKRALVELLGTLGGDDRFRLVAFSGGVRRYREGWTRATSASRADGAAWVRALEAQGGTNIGEALAAAFEGESGPERLPVVVFLTDGRPTVGETDPERLARQADADRGRTRVFGLGIGDDVNTYVLERLAESGRGSAAFLAPGADLEAEIASLASRISHPVLTDLALTGRDAELYHALPAPLPDLFAGEELVVAGRYRARGRSWGIAVRGTERGRERRLSTTAADGGDENAFIPRLWAARRVAALTREVRLHGPNEELVEEIRRLGLRFGILTEYTAYLVQEPDVLADAPLPEGVRTHVAPAAQAGRAARERAALSQAYRAAADVKALDEAQKTALVAAAPAGSVREAGGRLFVRRGAFWHDLGVRAQSRVVRIQAFSDAYLALARVLPEIRPFLSLGDGVRVAGRAVTLEIGPDGQVTVGEAALRRLVAQFRP